MRTFLSSDDLCTRSHDLSFKVLMPEILVDLPGTDDFLGQGGTLSLTVQPSPRAPCTVWGSRTRISPREAAQRHTWGLTPKPRCARPPPRVPQPFPHYFFRAQFSLQTPVERSERVAGCWAVRARANPLSLGVWHFTLRFVLPRSWVGYPCRS